MARIPWKIWSSPQSQQKSPRCTTWMQSQKWQNDLCSFPRQTIQYTVIQVYVPTRNAEESEVAQCYENLQELLELALKKDVHFIIGDWNAKVGSQEVPGLTSKFDLGVQNEAGQRLTVFPRECICHSKYPLLTTQETILHMAITGWAVPKSDWLYSLQPKMEKLYTVSKNESGSWLWLRSCTPYRVSLCLSLSLSVSLCLSLSLYIYIYIYIYIFIVIWSYLAIDFLFTSCILHKISDKPYTF